MVYKKRNKNEYKNQKKKKIKSMKEQNIKMIEPINRKANKHSIAFTQEYTHTTHTE